MKGLKPTLDEALSYDIEVAGIVEADWSDWFEAAIDVDEKKGNTVSHITGVFDQAALQGILQRLYSFGYPLISVNRINVNPGETKE